MNYVEQMFQKSQMFVKQIVEQLQQKMSGNIVVLLPSIIEFFILMDSMKKTLSFIPIEIIMPLTHFLEQKLVSQNCINLTQQNLGDLHFSLCLIYEVIGDQRAEKQCQIAYKYNRNNPLISINLSFYLFKRNSVHAIKYLARVNISHAIKNHRRYFQLILDQQQLALIKTQQLTALTGMENKLLKKRFINRFFIVVIQFHKKIIEENEGNYQSFVQLAKVLFLMNKFDDALDWTNRLRNLYPQSPNIIYSLSIMYEKLKKYDICVDCCRQVIMKDPKFEPAYEKLIIRLVDKRQYDVAMKYVKVLFEINALNLQVDKLMGRLLFEKNRWEKAIVWFQISLKLNNRFQSIAIIKNIQKSNLYSFIGDSFLQLKIFQKAAIFYLKSLRVAPFFQTYVALSSCFGALGQILNMIQCLKQAISNNFLQIAPFLGLGRQALKNNLFALSSDQFMNQLMQKYPQNENLRFNIAVYFIHRNNYKYFQEFMMKYLKQTQQDQNQETIYSNIISSTLIKYQKITQYFKFHNNIFTLFIGIFSKIKGNYIQAHKCYNFLFDKYRGHPNLSLESIFGIIYQRQLSKCSTSSLRYFAVFLVSQMIYQSPKQAIRCYYRVLNDINLHSDQFGTSLFKFLAQNVEIGYNHIFVISNKMDKNDPQHQHKPSVIIELDNYIQVIEKIDRFLLQIQNLQEKSEEDSLSFFTEYFQAPDRGHLRMNKDIIKGIKWNQIYKKVQYRQLISQINEQEQIILNRISNYGGLFKSNKKLFVKNIYLVIYYYMEQFIVNQTIKLMLNNLSFSILQNKTGHLQLASSLLYFKKHRFNHLQILKDKFIEIFSQNFNLKRKVKQKINKSESNDSDFSNIAELKSNYVYAPSQTQSQYGMYQSYQQYLPPFLSRFDEQEYIVQENLPFARNPLKRQRYKLVLSNLHYASPNDQKKDSQSQQSQSSSNLQQYSQFAIGQAMNEQVSSNSQTKFIIIYSPNKIKFSNCNKYAKFNNFLFQNTFEIIKYLSQHPNCQYIARHYCKTKYFYPKKSFKIYIEHGDQMVQDPSIVGDLQERSAKWICFLGNFFIYQWIIDIALAISELQQLGIYHADLAFRNTIRITVQNNSGFKNYIFKLIDFDKAFKVRSHSKKDKAYECTKNLLNFWLRFRFDQNKPKAPIGQAYQSFSQSKSRSSQFEQIYSDEDIISFMFFGIDNDGMNRLKKVKYQQSIFTGRRLAHCLQLLSSHMIKSHFTQFKSLVVKLLDQARNQRRLSSTFPQEAISKIVQALNELQVSNTNLRYIHFANRVKRIRKDFSDCQLLVKDL